MGATFVGICLIYLHLLNPAERVFGARVATPRTLCAWNQILSPSGLDIATCRKTVSETMMIEVSCCVMHIFAAFTILASAHQLIIDPSGASTSCSTTSVASTLVSRLALLTYDCHPVEVILCEIKMLTSLVFHFSSLQIDWQLLDFEIIFLLSHASGMDLRALRLISRLAVIIV